MTKRRHVFISHHHADDRKVSGLTGMLSRAGYDIRNSSIRAKPANQRRLDEGRISDKVIARLLRMKMSWATTVVVLIGRETHTRPWVDWEINKAHTLGKRIVGVYERGGTENDLPEPFKKYGDALVAWNSDSVMDAIDGKSDPFQNPDGTPRQPTNHFPRNSC
ncbi:MAG: TIR domain-containing protein [Comamonas sp.]|uniref:TIR domain-containing protein n=1 Tax=Comamonas sp. TaxID=34028 RepID=UPI002FC65F6A